MNTHKPQVCYKHVFNKFLLNSIRNKEQTKIKKTVSADYGYSNSFLIKLCKQTIVLNHGENSIIKQGSFASKISMTFLLDNIYMLLFMKDYEENIHYIHDFEKNVYKKRNSLNKEHES